MQTKLTKKQIWRSVFSATLNTIVLLAITFGLLAIRRGSECISYIEENYDNAIFILAAIVFLTIITYCYMYYECRRMFLKVSKQIELFMLLDLSCVFSFLLSRYLDANARPFGFFAIMCATLIGRKEAMFFNMISALLMFVIDININIDAVGLSVLDASMWQYCSCFLMAFCTGMLVIFVSRSVKTRLQSVLLVFLMVVPIELIIIVTEVFFGGTTDWILLAYGALGAAFSTLLYLILLPAFELLFSELTTFRLREITAPNAPLMKKLKSEAPGTYNHSVVVSQLVEACAVAIGEDGEMARAAALYHDVGKLKNPSMFTENQSDYNMHNELTPELSADIIRSHTRDGAKLIKKYHLPEFLADAAIQHHGTLPIKYFYAKAIKMSDGEVPIADFSYPGPVPSTKIVAILMIADAAEAASRSLKDRSTANIERLVGGLIEERMNLDQFVNCNITMRDLTVISRTIAQSLSGVYHSRIAYPKLKVGKSSK